MIAKKALIVPLFFLVFLLAACNTNTSDEKSLLESFEKENAQDISFKKLTEPELIFTGGFADPTYIQLADETQLLFINYFGSQPSEYRVYSSSDGLKWQKKSGTLPKASTGRAVRFGSKVRLYYPDQTPIRPTDPPASILSAISSDGFTFTNEAGTRVDPRVGYYLEGPTVFQLVDGTYRMYFSENDLASAEKRISTIWGASSDDGLTWERDDELTLESTPEEYGNTGGWDQALHPFVLKRPNGTFLMFYNTHSEVYAAESKDGVVWQKLGRIGIHGADVDGYYLPDGSIRLYYGDFSPETLGVVYTVDIQEEN